MRTVLGLTAFLSSWVLAGCGSDDAPRVDCGEGGEYFADDAGRYCAYIVIVGGFTCPAALPIRIAGGDSIVCTDRSSDPERIPASVCERVPMVCGGSSADGGSSACPPGPEAPLGGACDDEGLTCRFGYTRPECGGRTVICRSGTFEELEHTDPGAGCVDGGTSDAADSGDARACRDDLASEPQPSVHDVRFTFSGSGFVVSAGASCAGMQLQELLVGGEVADIPLALGFQCLCECAPPRVHATALVDASEGGTIAWDGRVADSYSTCLDCAMRGFPGAPGGIELHEVLRPARAARYRATFAVQDTLPAGCTDTGTEITCSGGATDPVAGTGTLPLCTSNRTVSVELDLPESGSLTVPVAL